MNPTLTRILEKLTAREIAELATFCWPVIVSPEELVDRIEEGIATFAAAAVKKEREETQKAILTLLDSYRYQGTVASSCCGYEVIVELGGKVDGLESAYRVAMERSK